MDLIYDYQMTAYPETATWLDYLGKNDRWTDHSLAAINQRNRDSRTLFKAIKAIKAIASKNPSDTPALNYKILYKDLSYDAAAQAFPAELMPVNPMGGAQ